MKLQPSPDEESNQLPTGDGYRRAKGSVPEKAPSNFGDAPDRRFQRLSAIKNMRCDSGCRATAENRSRNGSWPRDAGCSERVEFRRSRQEWIATNVDEGGVRVCGSREPSSALVSRRDYSWKLSPFSARGVIRLDYGSDGKLTSGKNHEKRTTEAYRCEFV